MSSKPGTRTLYLPSGGTMEIPLPGSQGRFTVNQPSMLASAGACPHLASTILIGVTVGLLVGTAATAWWLNRK